MKMESCFLLMALVFATFPADAREFLSLPPQNLGDKIETATPLIKAIKKNDNEAAMKYINKGEFINGAALNGVTPLILSVIENNADITKALVEHGADVNAQISLNMNEITVGMTPLMFAAEAGNTALTLYLISKGANIHAQDAEGMTALMYAVISKNFNTVYALGEAGAAYYYTTNNRGATANTMAYAMHLDEILNYLRKKTSEATVDQFSPDK